jgi:hypothetical protein
MKTAQSLLQLGPNNPLLSGFKWLKEDIEHQNFVYQKLWRCLAVEEGLEYPTRRFQILAWHYTEAINDLEAQKTPHNHQLKAEWIWRNGKRTSVNWGNRTWFYFYKIIQLIKPLTKATLQGIAANHMKIAVNGNELGEILSRFSLSQFPIAKAVQWYDITANLQEGKNILCVDGINWCYGIGGINIILHLEYTDGTTEDIYSDKTWKYFNQKPTQWPFSKIEDLLISNQKQLSLPVRSYGCPPGAWHGPISEPNWKKGWKSNVSFIFGNRNFIENSISAFVGFKWYKRLFWAVPLGTKIMKVDLFGFRKKLQ